MTNHLQDNSSPHSKDNLQLMVLNAQDLFLFMDLYNGEDVQNLSEQEWQKLGISLKGNKPSEKCRELAKCITDNEADIVMVCEVGGPESLANFAKHFLKDEYISYSLPSNSDRGIDLGYLVKKDLPLKFNLKSHKDRLLRSKIYHYFSRDVLELSIGQDDEIKLVLLLTHLKSKLDMKKEDYEGRSRRQVEMRGVLDLFLELQNKYQCPVLIGGDFNGNATEVETEQEFEQIYHLTDLKDVCSWEQIPIEQRISYYHFNRSGTRISQQLDYLFVPAQWSSFIVSGSVLFPHYRNLAGMPLPLPDGHEKKAILPSDHLPLLAKFRLPPKNTGKRWPF
jgi:hypothetical protein